jgi:uncharacterized protein YcsI (UPF0317 family)
MLTRNAAPANHGGSQSGRDVGSPASPAVWQPYCGARARLVQGNLAILPRDWADEFLRFCVANPKPCPPIGIAEPGDSRLPALGADLDIRTDLGRYRVWRNGELADEPADIRAAWRDDLVSFVIGCSFSFEEPLIAAGIPIRHIARGCNVSMYRTNVPTTPAGRFHGPLVVSMRPLKPADAIAAVQITSRLSAVHGAPVHIGFPEAIGIPDLDKPDFGDAVPMEPGELPVFWACGVTPQAAIAAARPPLRHHPRARPHAGDRPQSAQLAAI